MNSPTSQFINESDLAQPQQLSKIQRCFVYTIGIYFIIALHYFQPNPGGSGLETSNNPLGWIAISIICGLGILQIAINGVVRISPLLKVTAAGCFLMVIPVFYDLEASAPSYSRLLGLIAGLTLLFAIEQINPTKQIFKKLLYLVLIGVLIETLFSLIQYYILPFQHYLVIETTMLRPAAVFFQPNVAATFFVTGLLISLHLRQLAKREKITGIQALILNLVPFFTTMAIVILQSRTAYIAAIICIAIMCLSHRGAGNKKWLALVLAGIVTALVSISLLDTPTRDAAVYSEPGIRTQQYLNSIELIKQQPLTGHGYGQFDRVFADYQANQRLDQPLRPEIRNLTHPHNEIMYWGVEGGIIPIFGLLLIIGGISWQLSRLSRPFGISCFSMLAPLAFHTMTEYPFYHSVASWLLFILLLSYVANSQSKQQYRVTINSRLPYQLLTALMILLTSVYMLTTLHSQQMVMKYLINQQPGTLLQVINPFSPNRYQIELNRVKLNISIANKIDPGVSEYITWAQQMLSHQPRAYLYEGLIIANFYLNDLAQVNYWRQQALFHFPHQQWPQLQDMQLKVTQKS